MANTLFSVVNTLGKLMVPLSQVLAQAEHFDFFGALRAGAQQAQVIEQPALGSPAVQNRVSQAW